LGIGGERARQIVRKQQRLLKSIEDPFALKIKELSSLGDATRILNALRGNDLYDGDPEKLVNCNPEDLRKINGLGIKRISVIAKALECMGLISTTAKHLCCKVWPI